jgi:zinc protease
MPKKTVLLVLIGLFLASSLLMAEDNPLGWKISKTQLDNGLKIIVLEDHSTPSVAFQIWYHVGSKNEHPGITGISHMIEHMMFKGTKDVGPEEHARIIQSKGGVSNAFTHFDMTAYHEVLGAQDLETAAKLEADRMANLLIDSAALASERDVVAEERRTSYDNSPFGPVFEQLLNTVYTAHPYHWLVIGYMSDIQHFTHQKLREYWNTYYKPNNATAVIVGDVKTKDAIDIVKKYYADIKPGPPNPYRPITVEPPQRGERRAEIHKIAQLPGVFAGYKVVEAGNPDVYPLRVLGKILFEGESSRAYKRLVDDEQLCLFAGGDMFEFEDPGLFYVIAVMKGPEKSTADAEKILYEEIDKLKTEPVPQEELQKALNQIEAEKWYQLESNEEKGYAIGWFETVRGDYNYLFDEMDNYLSVTAEDIMRVANEYFDANNRNVVTLVPESSGAPTSLGF